LRVTYDLPALRASFDAWNDKLGVRFDRKFVTGMVVSTYPNQVEKFVHPDVTADQLQAIHENAASDFLYRAPLPFLR
jgi:hypothetical protein